VITWRYMENLKSFLSENKNSITHNEKKFRKFFSSSFNQF
jgi:hypothetical protein